MSDVIPLCQVAPDARALIKAFRDSAALALHQVPLADARANYLKACAANGLPSEPVAAVETVQCPVDGGAIALRIYRGMGAPEHLSSPVVVYLHGGGWVVGNLDSHDTICRRLANASAATVIAVDYRLAPEHPFPVPLHDCRDALAFIATRASAWRLDLASLVMAGDSAGANLATLMSGHAELRPDRLAVAAQVLLYPVTDLSAGSASYRRITSGLPLTAAAMYWFRDMYTAPGADLRHPLLSPIYGPDDVQPPMFIVTAGLDPLADEGIAYAAKAAMAGGAVVHHHLPRHMHGIFTSAGKVATGRIMLDQAAAFVRDIQGTPA